MNDLVSRFTEVMSKEKDIYERLLKISEGKKGAILSKETKALDAIVREEQSLILRLEQLEKRRIKCSAELAREINTPLEGITLLLFAEQGTLEQSEVLIEIHKELSTMLETLSKHNEENKALLDSRLEYVHFAMDTLTPDQNPGVYSTTGNDGSFNDNTTRTGIIDRKV